jgi:hypothetical protein
MSRWLAARLLAASLLLLAGCGLMPNDPVPAKVEGPGDPQLASGCEPPLAFDGETTIAELGLADSNPGLGDSATRQGRVQITQETFTWEEFAPPDVPAAVPEGQMLCVTWADGSGMSMLLPEPFPSRPAEGDGLAASIPWAAILAGVAIALVIGASWFAFRREAPRST